MKMKIKLSGLCCANCAAKIEEKTAALDGVESVSVNFLTEKMILTAEDAKLDGILQQIEKIVHKIEPDVEVVYRV